MAKAVEVVRYCVAQRAAARWACIPSFRHSSSSSTGAGSGMDTENNQSDDLYAVLGVARGSSPDEIKAAYRRMVKDCHPDMNPNDPIAEARFREVSNAYSSLLHVGLRRMYDLHLRRQEAQKRREHLDEIGKKNLNYFFCRHLGLSSGFAAGISFGTLTAAVTLLLAAGVSEWTLRSPGRFWICFRYIPDWMPGKWWLAEYFATAIARRRETVGVNDICP